MGFFGRKKVEVPPHPRREPRIDLPLTVESVRQVFADCVDFSEREAALGGDPDKLVTLCYISGMVKMERASDYVLRPLAQDTVLSGCGMAQAMEQTGLPYLISFMIRKDGRLIDGTPISQAISAIDAATGRHPLCYMTNCVHPSVLRQALLQPENRGKPEMRRFLGIQANTSPLSPEELDGAEELFCSEPEELAEHMAVLEQIQPFKIFGGCCGTDGSHMQAIAKKLSGQ